MKTTEIVDELVQRFHGWDREGEHGIVRFLNEAHNILMSMVAEQTLIFDETTGALPLLVTTATIRTYNMPTTVWRVENILIKIDENYRLSDYNRVLRTSYINSVMIGGIQYARYPYVRKSNYRRDSVPAKVMFTVDPGNSTNYYYRQSYKRPVQILSESIEHEVPPPQDVDYLIPATAKLIEGVTNGNYDDARRIINFELKPKMWQEMNDGAGAIDDEPVDRGF